MLPLLKSYAARQPFTEKSIETRAAPPIQKMMNPVTIENGSLLDNISRTLSYADSTVLDHDTAFNGRFVIPSTIFARTVIATVSSLG
jgi:hypothetical protein